MPSARSGHIPVPTDFFDFTKVYSFLLVLSLLIMFLTCPHCWSRPSVDDNVSSLLVCWYLWLPGVLSYSSAVPLNVSVVPGLAVPSGCKRGWHMAVDGRCACIIEDVIIKCIYDRNR